MSSLPCGESDTDPFRVSLLLGRRERSVDRRANAPSELRFGQSELLEKHLMLDERS